MLIYLLRATIAVVRASLKKGRNVPTTDPQVSNISSGLRHIAVVRDNRDYHFQYLAITLHLNQTYYQLACSKIVLPNCNLIVNWGSGLVFCSFVSSVDFDA
jgi:hypothetical protein